MEGQSLGIEFILRSGKDVRAIRQVGIQSIVPQSASYRSESRDAIQMPYSRTDQNSLRLSLEEYPYSVQPSSTAPTPLDFAKK
jgi:hypothetical protein